LFGGGGAETNVQRKLRVVRNRKPPKGAAALISRKITGFWRNESSGDHLRGKYFRKYSIEEHVGANVGRGPRESSCFRGKKKKTERIISIEQSHKKETGSERGAKWEKVEVRMQSPYAYGEGGTLKRRLTDAEGISPPWRAHHGTSRRAVKIDPGRAGRRDFSLKGVLAKQ